LRQKSEKSYISFGNGEISLSIKNKYLNSHYIVIN
jgi:hypothetical protein